MDSRTRSEEKRFYAVKVWEWNEKKGEDEPRFINDLTIEEAKELYDRFPLDRDHPQIDIWFDDEFFGEKIACKGLLDDGVWEETPLREF